MSEFHTVGGRYDIHEKWVGLDYANAFLKDPVHVEGVVIHEYSHAIVAGTDYGQASHVIFNARKRFKHVSASEAENLEKLIFFSQDFVQEDLATLIQVLHLMRHMGKRQALEWVDTNLPPLYLEKFNKLRFVCDMSQRYRDFFTNKAHKLAMDNNFQQDISKLNLLKDVKTLSVHLSNPDYNPNKRLEAIADKIRSNPWLVTKNVPEIAEKAGIKFFDVASKEEGAAFLTYVSSLTDKPRTFTPNDIGDPVTPEELRDQTTDSLLVTNLNIDLANNTELLFDKKDFLHYADVYDTVFINYHNEDWEHRGLVRSVIGEDPDIAMVGFTKTGEKYSLYCSKATAENILDKELSHTTKVVKWGGYSMNSRTFIWASKVKPDIVCYNSPLGLKRTLEEYLKSHQKAEFKYLHIGATEDHPIMMLYVMEPDLPLLHIASDFGNVRISKAIQLIMSKSQQLDHDDLRSMKQHVNNFMHLQGMHRTVDWVETMIVQDELVIRTD